MWDWILLGALVVSGALALLVLVVLWRDRAVARTELAAARDEAAQLRARVDALAAQVSAPVREPEEFVITHLGDPEERAPVAARIDGRLFADIVIRETAVKAAALGFGVRRALSPENRNRIRFEIKREVRRARRQRRADVKQARREWEARQRALLADPADGEDAA